MTFRFITSIIRITHLVCVLRVVFEIILLCIFFVVSIYLHVMNSVCSLAELVLLGISLCSSDVAWEAPT